ncbi:MAG: hypothetical protein SF069_18980 [Phycisphaerae bacterium]|nr:hypothetical protein [Phycisphaerae bacterium]
MTEKQKPVHTIRFGSVKAAIWENKGEKGTHYNVSVARLYKQGNDWKLSDSFGRDDLLVAAKVLDLAHSWIHEQAAAKPEEAA